MVPQHAQCERLFPLHLQHHLPVPDLQPGTAAVGVPRPMEGGSRGEVQGTARHAQ